MKKNLRSAKFFLAFCVFTGSLFACCNFAAASDRADAAVRIVLVGDSTMATRSGYGDALCALFAPSVTCLNMAKGGRSSKSYRAEGSWDQVLDVLRARESFKRSYVLVQFGHNDQPGKAERSTTLPEFTENMTRYVAEIRASVAAPILVTPLTRRQFKNGKLIRSLEEWAQATRSVAAKTRTPLLDLNRDSAAAVESMGSTAANELAQAPPPTEVAEAAKTGTTIEAPKPEHPEPGLAVFDYTHLGVKGAEFFAAMVAKEIFTVEPDLAHRLRSGLP